MAAKKGAITTHRVKKRKKRPGVHSKKKNSRSKGAKNYQKRYKGQGK